MTRDEAQRAAEEQSKRNGKGRGELGAYRQGLYEGFMNCYDAMTKGPCDGWLVQNGKHQIFAGNVPALQHTLMSIDHPGKVTLVKLIPCEDKDGKE